MKQLVLIFSTLIFISFQSNAQVAERTMSKPAMEKSNCCTDSTATKKGHDKMMKGDKNQHDQSCKMCADSSKKMDMKDHKNMDMKDHKNVDMTCSLCADSSKASNHDHKGDAAKMNKDGKKMMKESTCTDSCQDKTQHNGKSKKDHTKKESKQ